jgi:hypothetical protein
MRDWVAAVDAAKEVARRWRVVAALVLHGLSSATAQFAFTLHARGRRRSDRQTAGLDRAQSGRCLEFL